MCLSAWIGLEMTENGFNVTERSVFGMEKIMCYVYLMAKKLGFFLYVGLFFPYEFTSNARCMSLPES
jgi:hypothetical protein